MQFYRLAPGARFAIDGREYRKLAMAWPRTPIGFGHVFQAGTEVNPIGEPILLSEAEADNGSRLNRIGQPLWTQHRGRVEAQTGVGGFDRLSPMSAKAPTPARDKPLPCLAFSRPIKPKIRLMGHWLERLGFQSGE
jgi:hypothetical protein